MVIIKRVSHTGDLGNFKGTQHTSIHNVNDTLRRQIFFLCHNTYIGISLFINEIVQSRLCLVDKEILTRRLV